MQPSFKAQSLYYQNLNMVKMNKTTKIALITYVIFGIYYVLDEMYFKTLRSSLTDVTGHLGVSHILTYAISGIPLLIGAYMINRKISILESLGLNKSIFTGILFALICTSPLYIGFAFLFDINTALSLDRILISVVAAGFFEELFFRGFLFGLPFRYTRLGFIPAIFLGALFFGLMHMHQSTELGELVGIFLITFLGGILFAWVYVEWDYNIWVPTFLHALMNLAWELFSVSDNALGGIYANVFRMMCIALVIILTIMYKKRKGLPLAINRSTIWMRSA